jgi:hypothetical protein
VSEWIIMKKKSCFFFILILNKKKRTWDCIIVELKRKRQNSV